jgi:hypothetical protein
MKAAILCSRNALGCCAEVHEELNDRAKPYRRAARKDWHSRAEECQLLTCTAVQNSFSIHIVTFVAISQQCKAEERCRTVKELPEHIGDF